MAHNTLLILAFKLYGISRNQAGLLFDSMQELSGMARSAGSDI
jgi:hypothetical protein